MSGQKAKQNCLDLNSVKSPDKFIYKNQFAQKSLIVFQHFCRKVAFWGAAFFSSRHFVKEYIDFILDHNLVYQKLGKICRNSKILSLSSQSFIFSIGIIFLFFNLMNIEKVSIFRFFVFLEGEVDYSGKLFLTHIPKEQKK